MHKKSAFNAYSSMPLLEMPFAVESLSIALKFEAVTSIIGHKRLCLVAVVTRLAASAPGANHVFLLSARTMIWYSPRRTPIESHCNTIPS